MNWPFRALNFSDCTHYFLQYLMAALSAALLAPARLWRLTPQYPRGAGPLQITWLSIATFRLFAPLTRR